MNVEPRLRPRRHDFDLQDLQSLSEEWYWRTGPDVVFSALSPNAAAIAGIEPAQWLGRRVLDVLAPLADVATFASGRPFRGAALSYVDRASCRRVVSLSGKPLRDARGQVTGWHGIGRDATADWLIDRDANNFQEVLLYGLEAIAEGFAVYDADDRLVLFNHAYHFYSGPGAPRMHRGQLFPDIIRMGVDGGIYAASRGREEAFIAERLEYHRDPRGVFQVELADGRWIQYIARRLPGGGTVIIHTDITANKHRDEKQIRAQRLQALGQLTGGVAHDFGNLLFLLEGNVDLIVHASARGEDSTPHLAACTTAFKLGHGLIRQLLAVARQQPLQPRIVDANDLVEHVRTLIGRTISRSIALEASLDADLWRVLIDPSQLETAILNLCLNARDAMPAGGTLQLETSNVAIGSGGTGRGELAPGSYVSITVRDSGIGMSREISNRAIEPFFTTKEASKGAGLGLAMAYGFIKQSGGELEIDSAPGNGTTIRILLPAVDIHSAR